VELRGLIRLGYHHRTRTFVLSILILIDFSGTKGRLSSSQNRGDGRYVEHLIRLGLVVVSFDSIEAVQHLSSLATIRDPDPGLVTGRTSGLSRMASDASVTP
jgi:hypothetical protein